MKRLPLLFAGLFLFCSCSSSDSGTKVPLFHYSQLEIDYSSSKDYMLNHITPDDFKAMNQRKEPFVLFVWANGCGTCDEFSLSLKEYIHQTSAVIRYMRLYSYIETDNHLDLTDSALLFYSGGKLISFEDDLKEVGSTKDLTTMMNRHVYDSGAEILNSGLIEYPLAPEYNTFTFNDSIGIRYEEEGFLSAFQYDALSGSNKNVLFYNSDKLGDYSVIESQIKENSVSYIADIRGDLSSFGLSSLSALALTDEEKSSSYFIKTL